MKINKILSAVLSIALCLPSTGFTAEAYDISTPEISYTKNTSTIAYGNCGAELKWWLEDNGTLTISGNDIMTSAPWDTYRSQIKSVILDKDIKNIYKYAFSNLTNLTSVEFKGSSITSIEEGAFSGCSSLKSITIPDSVTYIGQKAFYNSGCYENVNGVHYIGSWAVGFDSDITSVSLRSGTKRLAEKAFLNAKSIKTISIPSTLIEISNGAFSGTGVTSLVIPGNVKKIGSEAFKFCISLETLTLRNGITSIGMSAFSNCNRLELLDVPESVTSMASWTFYDCTSLKTIKIPNPKCSVNPETFGFSTATSLVRDIYAPVCSDAANYATNPYYSQHYVYHSMDGSGEENGISWSFTVKDGTLSLTGSGTVESISSSKSWSGIKNDIKTIYIDGNITGIGKKAFYGYENLGSAYIKAPVETIGENAFSDCTFLHHITLSDNTKTIGIGAFSNTAVFSITVPDPMSGIKSITLPESLKTISQQMFSECSELRIVDIPKSVDAIEKNAFNGCTALKEIYFRNSETEIYSSPDTIPENAVIYGIYNSTAHKYADKYSRSFVEIGEEYDFSNLKVKYYDGSGKLIISGKGEMPEKSFSEYPWKNYKDKITDIEIQDGIENIAPNAFKDFTKLKSINIADSVRQIGDSAFSGCISLKDITLNNGLEKIGSYSFSGCQSIERIILPDSLTYLGESAFSGCTSISSLTIPDKVSNLRDSTFSGCTALTSIKLPDKLESIEMFAFSNCKHLTSITIPENTTKIDDYTFNSCNNLRSISFPASIKSISKMAVINTEWFSKQKNNGQLIIVNGILIDGSSVTDTSIVLNDITSIADYAFRGCSGITKIIIPESVESIGNYAFSNCTSLEDVVINGTPKYGDGVFSESDNLKKIVANDPMCTYPTGITSFAVVYGYSGSPFQMGADGNENPFVSIGEMPNVEYYDTTTSTTSSTIASTTVTTTKDPDTIYVQVGQQLRYEELANRVHVKEITDLVKLNALVVSGYDVIDSSLEAISPGTAYVKMTIYDETGKYEQYSPLGEKTFTVIVTPTPLKYTIETERIVFDLEGSYDFDSKKYIADIGKEHKIDYTAKNCSISYSIYDTSNGKIKLHDVISVDDNGLVKAKSPSSNADWAAAYAFGYIRATIKSNESRDLVETVDIPVEYHHSYKSSSITPTTTTTTTTTTTGTTQTTTTTTTSTTPTTTTTTTSTSTPTTTTTTSTSTPTTTTTTSTSTSTTTTTTSTSTSTTTTITSTTTSTTTTTKSTETSMTNETSTSTSTPLIKNNITELTMANGEQYTLYANQSGITFKSNNPDVAVISKQGVITAVGTGSAIISVINPESDVIQIKLEVIKVTVPEQTTATVTTNTTSTTTTTEIPSIEYLPGDVNEDKIIDGRDATDILTEYAKTSTGQDSKYSEEQKKAADVNNDGIIDGRDATAILTYYAKTSTGYTGTLTDFIESTKTEG